MLKRESLERCIYIVNVPFRKHDIIAPRVARCILISGRCVTSLTSINQNEKEKKKYIAKLKKERTMTIIKNTPTTVIINFKKRTLMMIKNI